MNILVTGASGFIGSYLCDFFIRQGYTVVATARDVNRVPAIRNPRFQVIEWDVLDKEGLETADLPVIDSVVHTATSNDILARKVGDGILLSTVGTKNVLDFCVKKGISKMVFFSTFQVYGTDLEGIVNENTAAKCQNDYGLNHIFGEQYMEMYAREKGIAGIVARPSNVYGRFTTPFIDRWTLVPGCFCKEITETGKITLRSSGRQTRNFVNLENIGRALHQILPRHKTGFEIYNIASSQNFSMLDVANMVAAVYEKRYAKKGRIEILSDLPAEKNSFSVDLQKLHEAGFTEDDKFNLVSVIDEIFIYLENKK
jgi:UDP-glucose 4-epimerase